MTTHSTMSVNITITHSHTNLTGCDDVDGLVRVGSKHSSWLSFPKAVLLKRIKINLC